MVIYMDIKFYKYIIYTIIFAGILFVLLKNSNLFGIKFYKNIKKIKNPENILVLVNKNNKLNKDYVPSDLDKLSLKYATEEKYLRKEAKIAFEKLSEEARLRNYIIIATSTYRSFEYQNKLYNYYVKTKGLEYADLCSARPGHSEHQTGLAVDVMGSNYDYDLFDQSIEFEWMKNNAHKFGFILRYPKGKELITGFKYEPWHYRYVGIELATQLYQNNITLEEYYKTLK